MNMKEFNAIPKGPNPCDAGCGKPATHWYGMTSCATCGEAKCVSVMDREREKLARQIEAERDNEGWY